MYIVIEKPNAQWHKGQHYRLGLIRNVFKYISRTGHSVSGGGSWAGEGEYRLSRSRYAARNKAPSAALSWLLIGRDSINSRSEKFRKKRDKKLVKT